MSHLYACLFSTGVIKVGRAGDPAQRIRQHAERVACLGVTPMETRTVACVGAVYLAEAAVLERCRLSASRQFKREWFEGLSFATVCDWLAEEAARGHRPAEPEPVAEVVCMTDGEQRFQCHWQDDSHVWTDARPQDALWPDAAVMRWNLRPSDWHRIWPELTDHPCAIFFAPTHPLRDGPPCFQDWVRSWPSADAGADLFPSMPETAQQAVRAIWPELASLPTPEKEVSHG